MNWNSVSEGVMVYRTNNTGDSMPTWTAPIGIPPARPKWFGVPTEIADMPAVYRISEVTGKSATATIGRIVKVFSWMAQWTPDGTAPSAHMIEEIVSVGESPAWRKKYAPVFAKSFLDEACNEDGECWLFTFANAATYNNRVRQREQMRKRRGGE